MNCFIFANRGLRQAGSFVLLLSVCGLAGACTDQPTGPADPDAISLTIVSGDNQTGEVGTELTLPLVVKATSLTGVPLGGLVVNFRVESGGGSVYGGAGTTDAAGIAKEYWTLGTGVAEPQVVEVRAVLRNGRKRMFGQFAATALAGAAAQIAIYEGDGQVARPLEVLPVPPAVRVTDRYGNPISGLLVTFSTDDRGELTAPTPLTDANGVARVGSWALGSPGLIYNPYYSHFTTTATATGSDISGNPVSFGAVGLPGLVAGWRHSCAIGMEEAAAFCWGSNSNGQLGDGTTTDRWTPEGVGYWYLSLAAGPYHTCGVTQEFETRCWGDNTFGQLGDGTTSQHLVPTTVAGPQAFTILTAGGSGSLDAAHTCALTTSGEAYCWGSNDQGQLGDGTTTGKLVPTIVSGILSFRTLSAGSMHTCGLSRDGKAYCWGDNSFGQLGDGTNDGHPAPAPVSGGLTFAQLTTNAAGFRTCGLTLDGFAYCWGGDDYSFGGPASALPVPLPGGLRLAALSAGLAHVCGITGAGDAFCWGMNDLGQLGTGTGYEFFWIPGPWQVASGLSFYSLASGALHSCALATGKGVYCWGQDYPRVPTAVPGAPAFFSRPALREPVAAARR